MPESQTEKADSALDALMARRKGESLPDPTCPHFSRDHEGRCWACVYDERERAMKAEAWDEGATKASPHGGAYLRSLLIENPYRDVVTLPGAGSSDG